MSERKWSLVDDAARSMVDHLGPGSSLAIDAQDWLDLRSRLAAAEAENERLMYQHGAELSEALARADTAEERAEKAERERDEARKFHLSAEEAYCGGAVFNDVIAFLTNAGCGRPGTPNTVWAMVQEIIRRAEAAESKLALAEWVVEAVKPLFSRFPQHRSPLDVELPNISELKELQGRLNQYTKME